MFIKRILSVMLPVALACGCSHEEPVSEEQPEALTGQHLKVAVVAGAPGWFASGGQRFGYCHDLFAEYARERGVELELVADAPLNTVSNRLRLHNLDAAVLIAGIDNLHNADKMSRLTIGTTRFVMLARERLRSDDTPLSHIVDDRTVMMSAAFQHTSHYDTLLDSLSRACLYVSSRNCRELAAELLEGRYDFLVCEASDAAMAVEFNKNLHKVFTFEDTVDVVMLFSPRAAALYEDFGEWWGRYSTCEEYGMLREVYFGGKFHTRVRSARRRTHGISVWDEVIRRVGEREGVDWLLLSAIAFEESMFRSDVISRSGATGLMQIMPITARHFNVDQESLADPETNVTIAAKLLKSIERSLDFPDSVAVDERLSIILAAYNCGQKTISDALAAAAATGLAPYRWESVAEGLRLMGSDDFCDSLGVRRFKGYRETMEFVADVRRHFNSYRRAME